MTKAELILKIAKNVGIPDADTKKFFELFLKKISAIVDIGQSIFVKEFGYFHLIKGTIKKPVFSFKDNEVSEEEVELVLFSEDKDLRKSDTKGLVFNIPVFDDEDYHPIDSAFSLSIGKPLIPLRGVPFEDIYIPTSGYEYKRLIESKVEKIVGASEIIETEEKFPTLVIDARSYNSNQVKLQWNEETKSQSPEDGSGKEFVEEKTELSEYEKQSKELKNIAWDFGSELSKQIEAESILDITDERLSNNLKSKNDAKKDEDKSKRREFELNIEPEIEIKKTNEVVKVEENFLEIGEIEDSSAKLDELLASESKTSELIDENFDIETIEVSKDVNTEEIIPIEFEFDDKIDKVDVEDQNLIEELKIEDDPSDKEFFSNTSKYFETYNPDASEIENEIEILNENKSEIQGTNEKVQEEEVAPIVDDDSNQVSIEPNNFFEQSETHNEPTLNNESEIEMDDTVDSEQVEEQKPEFFEPEKKRNLVPFIVFPLLIIVASVALYWYLEYYKKNETAIKTKQVVLKSDNANVISRSFDIPVTYPYKPKVNQTTISEAPFPKIEEQNVIPEKVEEKKPDQIKPDEKKVIEKTPEKVETKQTTNQIKEINKNILPTGKSLNVGNNIYKYGNYFVVQVAAFRSKSISENEAGKYRDKGLNAFVESAEIPDRGIWYRVRVGNFSSKEEAQKFLEKNIR